MKDATIRQRRVLNGYRAAASAMADARELQRAAGNPDECLDAYRRAARVFAAARELDRQLSSRTHHRALK